MKTKKLNLNKVTISKLEGSEMKQLNGGIQVIPKTGGAFSCTCPPPPPIEINKQ